MDLMVLPLTGLALQLFSLHTVGLQPFSRHTVGSEKVCEGECTTVIVSGIVLPHIFNASKIYA